MPLSNTSVLKALFYGGAHLSPGVFYSMLFALQGHLFEGVFIQCIKGAEAT